MTEWLGSIGDAAMTLSSFSPDAGKSAAKVKAKLSNNLSAILAQLLQDAPDDSDAELFASFQDLIGFNTAVVRHAALLEPMIERDFIRALHEVRPVAKGLSGLKKLEPNPKLRSNAAARQAARTKVAKEHVLNAVSGLIRDASLRLLELATPMGKSLGATTFGECAQLGGWYANLATKGPADQPIGDVLTEKQVRAFFDAYNSK